MLYVIRYLSCKQAQRTIPSSELHYMYLHEEFHGYSHLLCKFFLFLCHSHSVDETAGAVD